MNYLLVLAVHIASFLHLANAATVTSSISVESPTPSDCPRPNFIRTVTPSWTTVSLDGYSVDIPFSNDWHVKNARCLWEGADYDPFLYSVSDVDNGYGEWRRTLRFGRPANDLSSIEHEYSLSREKVPPEFSDFLPSNWSCGGTDIESPKKMTVGKVTGWRYFEGGAKWCDMVFQFVRGGYAYTLERNLEPTWPATNRTNAATAIFNDIDPEMKKIIESIK